MKNILMIIVLLFLKPTTDCAAQTKTEQPQNTGPISQTWQQYDSLAHVALVNGDTSAAIGYLESATAINGELQPSLNKLRKKYAQSGHSFYIKEY